MTGIDKKRLENNLFIGIRNNEKLEKCLKELLNDCQMRLSNKCENAKLKQSEIHELVFDVRYIKHLLDRKRSPKVDYQYMMKQTNETKSSYYRYRGKTLLKIKNYLEQNEQCI